MILRSGAFTVGVYALLQSLTTITLATPVQEVHHRDAFQRSSPAGNLVASALQHSLDVDVVLYPTDLIDNGLKVVCAQVCGVDETAQIRDYLPRGKKNAILVGHMTGQDIKRFIIERSVAANHLELQVAGLKYRLVIKGSQLQHAEFHLESGEKLDPLRSYRVALSKYYYKDVFPGYRFLNGLSRGFDISDSSQKVRTHLIAYLTAQVPLPDLAVERAVVDVLAPVGTKPQALSIAQVQGHRHLSPYLGQLVEIEGLVTAVGYPREGGTAFYLQSQMADDDPRTSEGIFVWYQYGRKAGIHAGEVVRVVGVVHERMRRQGLSETSLLDVRQITHRGYSFVEPQAVVIGGQGRLPPKITPRYQGDVNEKDALKLEEPMDFWESLEGMRVQVPEPRIVGFKGGLKERHHEKRFLNIFLGARSALDGRRFYARKNKNYYNPEIIRVDNHIFDSHIDIAATFKVGDALPANLKGVFGYVKDVFGNGYYTLLTSDALTSTSPRTSLDRRPQVPFVSGSSQLTIGNYNVQNLSALDTERLIDTGRVLSYTMRCPDIINLVEVQDNNGVQFDEGSAADETLDAIISAMECPGAYKAVNIDPLNHKEGGIPGGNIRVAMLYNEERVSFEPRGQPAALTAATFDPQGELAVNPARVDPAHPIFERTRRPLVAEFGFAGQRIFVIGTHFNSKGGDEPVFTAKQPPQRPTAAKRRDIARVVAGFVTEIQNKVPDAHVVVLGDFNDYYDSEPLEQLKAVGLKNLVEECPEAQRYTYNYQGTSQALDHILVSPGLYSSQPDMAIAHINSDYMLQYSDHDPLVARFHLGGEENIDQTLCPAGE